MLNHKKEYINLVHNNVKNNCLQYLLYRISIPVCFLFKKFGITPNQITFFSFFFCVTSSYFLIKGLIFYFIIFWYLSHFLDYCDGTLARITNNKTKILLRLDHFVDLIKLQVTMVSLCFFYKNNFIWLLFSIFNLFFWLGEYLNENYKSKPSPTNSHKKTRRFSSKFLQNIYNIVFTFNGHSLLLIGLTIINSGAFISVLIYYCFLSLKRSYTPLIYLSSNFRK